MSGYDGSIRVGTKIETKEAERELKDLESSITKTADKIASLRSKMDALENAKAPTKQYEILQQKLKAANDEVSYLIDKQKQYGDLGFEIIPQEMLNKAKSEVEEIEKQINQLVDDGKAFSFGDNAEKYAQMTAQIEQLTDKMQSDQQRATEIQSTLVAEEERIAQIKANATVSDQQMLALLERRKQLTQEIVDMERAGMGSGYKEYDLAQRELAQLNIRIKEYKNNLSQLPTRFNEMEKSAKKAFDAVSNGTKKSNGALSAFAGKIKGIAATVFIFSLIRKAFNAMVSGTKQGFSNFMDYSSDFANSVQSMKNAMSTLGNQFAAAFAPIVELIIPWLTKLISVIATAMTYVAQFIAILGGKSTFTRAKQVQDGYNKSLGGTAAAAKKAYGALAKFDDLDVLQKQEEDDAVGGAAGAMGDLFEEVPVDSKFKEWLDGILEKLKPILDYLKKLKDIFMEGFWDGLGDWEYRWEIIKDSLASIKDSLIDIFTDTTVLAAADKWVQSVAYMLGSLVGSMASIGLTIATNLLGGIAKYLEQNKDRIKGFLISMFDIWSEINYMFADLFQSIAYVFEAFASEQGQQLTANLIGIFADAFMGILELASKRFRDIANLIIQPFVDNKEAFRAALEGFLEVLADVTGTIKQGIDDTFDKLNEVYDAHFRPFFESVAQGLSDLVAKFLEFWNGNVQPILQQWAADFDNLWTSHIQPLLNNVAEFLGKVADLLKALWENVLQPFIAWIAGTILPYTLPIIQAIWNMLVDFVAFVADMINSLITIFSGIIDFLTGVFTGDWELALQGIEEQVSGFIDFVVANIESFLTLIRDIAQLFFETIKSTVESFVQAVKDIVSKFLTAIKQNVTEKQNEMSQSFQTFINNVKTKWNEGWEALKEKVSSIMNSIKEIIQSAFDWISEMVSSIGEKLGSIGSAISGALGFGGGAAAFSINGLNPIPVNAIDNIPHLASGSVIRGGNPFLAMLGDQPHGQTNIEAPLSTIEQAVENVMNRRGNSGGGLNPTISLNVNGEEFARLTLNDILSEMSRQGYDVEVLGVS